jgi:hypothetical protein
MLQLCVTGRNVSRIPKEVGHESYRCFTYPIGEVSMEECKFLKLHVGQGLIGLEV